MATAFNTTITLYQNVPLDSTYHNVLRPMRESETDAELAYYIHTPIGGLTGYSYQRLNRNYMRIQGKTDDYRNCNYMSFVNNSHSSKKFYAFIDDVEYVNENTVELSYTIDVMTTYSNRLNVHPCFVEREHSITDKIGDNLVPENVNTGDLLRKWNGDVLFNRFLAVLITNEPLPDRFPCYNRPNLYWKLKMDYTPDAGGLAWNGAPANMFVYAGFLVNDQDDSFFGNPDSRDYYYLQDFRPWDKESGLPTYPSNLNMTLDAVLWAIGKGEISGISASNIIGCYIYPADIGKRDNVQSALTYGYGGFCGLKQTIQVNRPTVFNSGTSADNYTPKNNKLFTYPFCYLSLSNHNGKVATYKFENWWTPFYAFGWVGLITPPAYVLLYPQNYLGSQDNMELGVGLSGLPTPAYKSDQYATWLQSNSESFNWSNIAAVLGGIGGIAGGVATANPIAITAGATSLFQSVGSALATTADIQNTPPQMFGQVDSSNLWTTIAQYGFTFYTHMLRPENAKIIDDYFSMFGYATNRLKTPNIFAESADKLRPHWNYVKTAGADFVALESSGSVSQKINDILDNGVTFWNHLREIGNYDLDNSPQEGTTSDS